MQPPLLPSRAIAIATAFNAQEKKIKSYLVYKNSYQNFF